MTYSADSVVVAIDQGTSSTKVLVLGSDGAILAQAAEAVGATHPAPGWVEQDAEQILASVHAALSAAIGGLESRVAAIGLSSQRESAVLWDRRTGKALGPVLGWQDRRTTAAAIALTEAGSGERVRHLSGLPIDPMFSALKLAWLLDQVDPDRTRSASGELAAGTIDSWLLFRLTGEHRIEVGNASRTQLLDLTTGQWSPELLELFRVPAAVLPAVVASTAPSAPVVGIDGLDDVRITAVLGDSHAALFGHGAREAGSVKVTYGTGSSIMGLGVVADDSTGLVSTIAWGDPDPAIAFEGNILSTGATIVWLAGLLETTPAALMALAETAPADHGIDLVPAFAGLGAPWWDETATALISGLGLGTDRAALARAAAESIALQIEDVLAAADRALGTRIDTILADGGPSANDWLIQLQADLSQRRVLRTDTAELSALGAAHLAGQAAGVWTSAEVLDLPRPTTEFLPQRDAAAASARHERWLSAVARSRHLPTTESVPAL